MASNMSEERESDFYFMVGPEVSISEEEVKIPLPEELYEKVKDKRVVIVPKG